MKGKLAKYILSGFIGILLIFNLEQSVAQDRVNKYLTIGDTLPDIPLKVFNYPDSIVKPSDFRGKLFLMDFWATWCASCVAGLPELEKLQSEFGDKVQILPIALDQSEDVIRDFYERRQQFGRPITLPSAVDDSLMAAQFYFKTISHVIWVNEQGKIIAITDSRPVNSTIIQKILDGEDVKLPLKYLDPTFDESKPLLFSGNGGSDTSLLVRSLMTPYKPEIRPSLYVGSSPIEHYFSLRNRNALQMYTSFYGHLSMEQKDSIDLKRLFERDYLYKRVLIECESEKIKNWPAKPDAYQMEEYSYKYRYCYELILPGTYSRTVALQKAIDDLDFFYQVKSGIEYREVECLALVRLDKSKAVGKKSGNADRIPKIDRANDSLQVINMPVEQLCTELTQRGRNLPLVFDETGLKENTDVIISFVKYTDDAAKLNLQLAKYNLKLTPKKYRLQMLVLRDKE